MKTIKYCRRGLIERAKHVRGMFRGYQFVDGYSETGPNGEVCFPWVTKRECRMDAKARGAKAEFSEET